jgi:hypothetical protein
VCVCVCVCVCARARARARACLYIEWGREKGFVRIDCIKCNKNVTSPLSGASAESLCVLYDRVSQNI